MNFNNYNMDWLLEEVKKEERVKYLFFWGHQPNLDGSVGASCLSQWWESDFVVEGQLYPTAEHWMMAGKAKLFGCEDVLEKILACKTAPEAKKLGREVRDFVSEIWEAHAFDLVVQGSIHKFGQDKALKEYLLNTGDRVLVEASPVDAIWGIGMAKDHKNIENPVLWRGTNLLGFALMEARDNFQIS